MVFFGGSGGGGLVLGCFGFFLILERCEICPCISRKVRLQVREKGDCINVT